MPTEIVKVSPVVQEVRTTLYKPGIVADLVRAVRSQDRVERMITLALNTVKLSRSLLDCEPRSIVGAVLEATLLNLEIDRNLGQAYLVPFKNKHAGNRKVCTMIIGYKGFIHLAHNSAQVSRLNSEVVRKEDEFQVMLGTERRLHHVPNHKAEGRDKEKTWVGAYATILYLNGTTDFEYLTADEINAVRARAPGKDIGPWVTDTEAMWKKTPIRRLCKRVPQSPENLNLVHAAQVDELRELGQPVRHKIDALPASEIVEDFLPDENEPIDVQEDRREVQRKSESSANSKTARASQPEVRTEDTPVRSDPGGPAKIDYARIKAIAELVHKKKMTDEEVSGLLAKYKLIETGQLDESNFLSFWKDLLAWKRSGR